MPVRDRRSTALPQRRPPAQACHLRGGAALVDEDQVLGVKVRLCVEPGLSPPGHVEPLLLGGVRGFF